MALKQNGVLNLIKQENLDVIGVLETKLNQQKLQRILSNKFWGWNVMNNFQTHRGGRILVLWNPIKVLLEPQGIYPQVIHCSATCKVSQCSFQISFVYGFYSICSRRPLWDNLVNFGLHSTRPWLVLGDFNNVLKAEEKCNGADVTAYETRDFVDCCLTLGLTDLQAMGCFYTWNNNTVWCKLDRALVNIPWMLTGSHGRANFLPPGCLSDHSPCIVSTVQQERAGRSPFRFFNMWACHGEFQTLVQSVWCQRLSGTEQFILCRKLKALKHPLKQLNLKHYGHISARASTANLDLKMAQLQLHDQPGNEALQTSVTDLRKRAKFLNEAERNFFQQQAKCSYLKNSDKCTKFFHDLVKRNVKRNHIISILKEDGNRTSSQQEVANEFVEYFVKLFGTRDECIRIDCGVLSSGSRITDQQAEALISDISDHEIKEALFDIGEDKSPGPDGFTSCFFKKSWGVVGDQFCRAVKEFFVSADLLKQVNHTIIALVPKSNQSQRAEEFRPIACCNVFYKVIAKIIATRLGNVLDQIVNCAQSAFVRGRNISDNIQLVQELLRQYCRKRASPRCIIKVDIRKAYDSVNWEFLRSVLSGLGFPGRFIDWVMECVSTPSYSIALNGSIFGFFKGKKGLRQGDPMSPFLFVLCLEYFSRLVGLATENSDFNFHPKCGKLKITHLAFADDLVLMARGDVLSVRILMQCIRDFGNRSGLRINVLKSSIYTAGITGQQLDEIQELTNIPRGSMPFRYLGIPLAAEKLKVMHYAPFIDKIAALINAWTCNSLSYAGRAELIRTVLQGVECFWLSILPIPATVISRITRLCRLFLWGSRNAPIAWKEVSLPRDEGGLGFRDLRCWNLALWTKLLWNIHAKKDTLWVRWINSFFLNGKSIWGWNPRKGDSPLFKKIAEICNILIQINGTEQQAVRQITEWTEGADLITARAYQIGLASKEKCPTSIAHLNGSKKKPVGHCGITKQRRLLSHAPFTKFGQHATGNFLKIYLPLYQALSTRSRHLYTSCYLHYIHMC
ncbi:hypothetical protein Pfo_007430 [Paulownia fortunei]|nr:hypothetical protein Pfo_007430 [Paulownia fortunei]